MRVCVVFAGNRKAGKRIKQMKISISFTFANHTRRPSLKDANLCNRPFVFALCTCERMDKEGFIACQKPSAFISSVTNKADCLCVFV